MVGYIFRDASNSCSGECTKSHLAGVGINGDFLEIMRIKYKKCKSQVMKNNALTDRIKIERRSDKDVI